MSSTPAVPYGPTEYVGLKVGQYVDIPVSHLVNYAGVRDIDEKHVAELGASVTSVADLKATPLKIYVAENGVVVVEDGAHRTQMVRETSDAAVKIPCIVVPRPSSPHMAFVSATAANMAGEVHRPTTFSDKICLISAFTEEFCQSQQPARQPASVSWSEVKAFVASLNVAKPGYVTKDESFNTFTVARSLKPWSDARLTSGDPPDARPLELFFALHNRSADLELLVQRKSRPLYKAFSSLPSDGNNGASADPAPPRTVNIGATSPLLMVDAFKVSPDVAAKQKSSAGFLRVLYLIALHMVIPPTPAAEDDESDEEEGGRRPAKRRRKNATAVANFRKTRRSGKRSSAEVLSEAVLAVAHVFDNLAGLCLLSSGEEMLLPYLTWDVSQLQFSAIPHATNFRTVSTASLQTTLFGSSMESRPAADPCPASVDALVWGRKEAEDKQLRAVAGKFRDVLRAAVVDPKLYDEDSSAFAGPYLCVYREAQPGAASDAGGPLPSELVTFVRRHATVLVDLDRLNELVATSERAPDSVDAVAPSSAGEAPHVTSEHTFAPSRSSLGRSKAKDAAPSSARASADGSSGPARERSAASQDISRPSRLQSARTRRRLPSTHSTPPVQGAVAHSPQDGQQVSAQGGAPLGPSIGGLLERNWTCMRSHFEGVDWTPYREKVQLVLTDPPYCTRATGAIGRNAGGRSTHDWITASQIQTAGRIIADLLRPAGHAVVFCSFEQVPEWVAALKQAGLFTDKTPMAHTRSRSGCSFAGGRRTASLQNCWEASVHAYKQADADRIEAAVNYAEEQSPALGCFVRNSLPRWLNALTNVDCPEAEILRAAGGTSKIRPEQKGLAHMKELITRFSQPGDLVADLFAGTFTTAAACVSMPVGQTRFFVGCEVDEIAFRPGKERVQRSVAKGVASRSLDSVVLSVRGGGVDVDALRRECDQFIQQSVGDRGSDVVADNPYRKGGLPGHSPLPPHLLSFLSSQWRKNVRHLEGIPANEWPDASFMFALEELQAPLLAADAALQGLYVAGSSVLGGGDGVFAARSISRDESIAWYGGTYLYTDLDKKRAKHRRWGPAGFGVTKKDFSTWALDIGDIPEDMEMPSGGTSVKKIWVVAAPFCAGGKVNDPRRIADVDATTTAREANAILDVKSVVNKESFRSDPFVASLKATRDIAVDEEIFASYGDSFRFDSR